MEPFERCGEHDFVAFCDRIIQKLAIGCPSLIRRHLVPNVGRNIEATGVALLSQLDVFWIMAKDDGAH
jgi:hypothetical protein